MRRARAEDAACARRRFWAGTARRKRSDGRALRFVAGALHSGQWLLADSASPMQGLRAAKVSDQSGERGYGSPLCWESARAEVVVALQLPHGCGEKRQAARSARQRTTQRHSSQQTWARATRRTSALRRTRAVCATARRSPTQVLPSLDSAEKCWDSSTGTRALYMESVVLQIYADVARAGPCRRLPPRVPRTLLTEARVVPGAAASGTIL